MFASLEARRELPIHCKQKCLCLYISVDLPTIICIFLTYKCEGPLKGLHIHIIPNEYSSQYEYVLRYMYVLMCSIKRKLNKNYT